MLKKLTLLLIVSVATLAWSEAGHAQATRTWVSGVGDDANPCSRTAPCKTFAGAISKTAPAGEIDVLDQGGFGAVTITKSITIDGGPGQIAGVLVSGTNGIVVAAATTDRVYLRNLQIDGIGTGLNGVNVISANLVSIEHCVIWGFRGTAASPGVPGSAAVNIATSQPNAIVNIFDTKIADSVNGIVIQPTSGTAYGQMDNSTIQKITGNGITTAGNFAAIFAVTRSNILNVQGVGVNSGGTGTVLGIDTSAVSSNNTAFKTSGGFIRISRNTIYDNNVNYSINGGTIATDGQNLAAVNGATVPNGTIAKQ